MISWHLSTGFFSPSTSIAYDACVSNNHRKNPNTRLLKLDFPDKFLCRNHLRTNQVVLRFEGEYFLEVSYCSLEFQDLHVARCTTMLCNRYQVKFYFWKWYITDNMLLHNEDQALLLDLREWVSLTRHFQFRRIQTSVTQSITVLLQLHPSVGSITPQNRIVRVLFQSLWIESSRCWEIMACRWVAQWRLSEEIDH